MEFTTETSISSQQLPPLTILDAINFAAGAWNRVKQRVIQSSWRRSGILPPMVQSPYSMANETEENLESEVINLVEQLPLEESMTTVREYIDLEEGTYNVTDYTEEQDSCMMREIVATIQGHSEEEEEEEEEELEKVSSAEAINNIDNLLLYMQQEDLNMELQSLTKLRKSVLGYIMQKKRQTRIYDYISFG
jgi:hypothetical protein